MKTAAAPAVSLVRKFPAPRLPKSVAPAPPPKTAPTCAPLPRWSSTTAIRKMQAITCRTVTTADMEPSLKEKGSLPARARSGPEAHDAREGLRVEARAADERAIDVGLRHQVVDVLGLNGAAVLDADRLRGRAEASGELPTHEPMDLLSERGGRRPAGSDGPHRLVGDDHLGRPLRRHLV